MLFLADESCDFAVVRALRAAGHDVVAVAEVAPRALDREVLRLAESDQRIVLTEDKDFGTLVFADLSSSGGVILIRFPTAARAFLSGSIVSLVEELGEELRGAFIVLEPSRARISRPRQPFAP